MRLKMLSDEMRNISVRVSYEILLTTLTSGLHEDFGNAASNLTILTMPTFNKDLAYLRLEERRMKHTTLAADTSRGAPAQSQPWPTLSLAPFQQQPLSGSPPSDRGHQRKHDRNRQAHNNNGGQPRPAYQQSMPPWSAGHNLCIGVVRVYDMPVPRASAPGLLGPRPTGRQAFFTVSH